MLSELLYHFSTACAGTLSNAAIVSIVKEHKGDFGFQQLYLYIGMVVFTPISGVLLDTFSGPNNMTNFGLAV